MKSGRRKRKWLSQVAVCVLLSVHSLQVLLLYENVDAFLEKKKDNTLVKVLLSLSHTHSWILTSVSDCARASCARKLTTAVVSNLLPDWSEDHDLNFL